jgi:hypothetical protein
VSRVILIVMDVTRGGLGMEKMEGREDVEGRCGVHRSDWTRLGRTDRQHSGQ